MTTRNIRQATLLRQKLKNILHLSHESITIPNSKYNNYNVDFEIKKPTFPTTNFSNNT